MMLMTCAILAQLLVRPWSQTNEPLDQRVARDFAPKGTNQAAKAAMPDVVHYAVPPMSSLQRLADVYPSDGKAGAPVEIVMAKDEYEPGSFLLWANKDFDKVTLELSDFKQVKVEGQGQERFTGVVFPKKNIDLKVIKVWYQNKNGWYSYFGDTGFKLCPELLLNDENLIRVDTKKEANYARLKLKDGTVKEKWINPPRQVDSGFRPMSPEFSDAETFQPVALAKNAFKQFFLTVHTAKNTPAGTYKGEIKVQGLKFKVQGSKTDENLKPETSNLKPETILSIPVVVRVLDFVLPPPKAYNDETKDFLVASYEYDAHSMFCGYNGGDSELAYRQLKAFFEDHVSHGQTISWLRYGYASGETARYVRTMREAGMQTDVMIGNLGQGFDMPLAMRRHAEEAMAYVKKNFGVKDFYCGHGDENGVAWLINQRQLFEAYQSAGVKFIMANDHCAFVHTGYIWDWLNVNRAPEDATEPRLWNQIPSSPHLAWYCKQHVGVENPEFNRRQNGMAPYLAGFSALCNYAHHFGPYNDDTDTYKPMVFAYGHYRGVIDTLQWEGFREGIDDIRYATLAVTLARKAAKSEDVRTRYAGNRLFNYLALVDTTRADLDTLRLELIARIRELKALGL